MTAAAKSQQPIYVCTTCYRSRSCDDSDCPRCRSPRFEIDAPLVREDLLEEVDRRLRRRAGLEWGICLFLAAAVAMTLVTVFGPADARDSGFVTWYAVGKLQDGLFHIVFLVVAVVVALPLLSLYRRWIPRAAIAVFHERRVRLAHDDAHDSRVTVDPVRFNDLALLDWLGARPDR